MVERRAVSNVLEPPETVEVESEVVSCDGGGGVLGHPKVYLSMEGRGMVDCPYCDKRFVLKAGGRFGGGH
jgi:uncharacterized Zn-finger protein